MDTAVHGWLGRLPKVLWTRRQCPLCSSIRFAEAEPGSLDRPLGLFFASGSLHQLLATVLLACDDRSCCRVKGGKNPGLGSLSKMPFAIRAGARVASEGATPS